MSLAVRQAISFLGLALWVATPSESAIANSKPLATKKLQLQIGIANSVLSPLYHSVLPRPQSIVQFQELNPQIEKRVREMRLAVVAIHIFRFCKRFQVDEKSLNFWG
jgi:hypothetical protein